jgi:hypothetical protein
MWLSASEIVANTLLFANRRQHRLRHSSSRKIEEEQQRYRPILHSRRRITALLGFAPFLGTLVRISAG